MKKKQGVEAESLFAIVYVSKDGEHEWASMPDMASAESEADIYRSHGDKVLGIFPVEVPRLYPALKLEGHDNSDDVFAELTTDKIHIKQHENSTEEEFVVGNVGGWEVTVANLRETSDWIAGVIGYLKEHGYKGKGSRG